MPPDPTESLSTSVLLINDSANHRAYWVDQLKRCSAHYQIVEASDAQSGLDLYRSQSFDCVVMDLALPDQSGFELLSELVPIPRLPSQ